MPIDPADFEDIRNDFTGKKSIRGPKYTGGKRHPRYLGPLRQAFQQTPSKSSGGLRRTLEPFMGGLNVSSNINPGGRALVADYNRFLAEMLNRQKNNDLVLDNEPFLNEEGIIEPKTYYEQIRGGTPRGRKQEQFDTSWKNLQPDSLNDFIRREKLSGGLTPDEHRKMIERWAQFQNLSWRGDPRMNASGYANQTVNAQDKKLPPRQDLGGIAPVYANYDIRGGLSFEDFFKLKLNPDDDMMVVDPPYAGGEGANYDHNMSEDQQKLLAELIGEQAAEGMPVVAFNNPSVAPLYEKHGFKTEIINRPDRYNNYNEKQAREKPEAVMHNIDDFDWFPKSETPFESSWDLLVKGIDIDFSEFPKAKERNMFFGDMLEEIPRTEEEELSEVQMDEKDDPCCTEAKEKLAQAWIESNNMSPERAQTLRDGLAGLSCDEFRRMLETPMGIGTHTNMDNHRRLTERNKLILAEWDACASNSNADWHNIAASADPFKTAWDSITKRGKFKGYSRSNISDRPYRQGKAKAWGIGRKVKRERTQKRYKRNQARGNFRPAMRRQLGAGGTRASSNR